MCKAASTHTLIFHSECTMHVRIQALIALQTACLFNTQGQLGIMDNSISIRYFK